MKKSVICLTALAQLSVSACGDTRWERAGSGAIVGGAAGGASGVICCGDPLNSGATGLVIGAAVGAIVGFVLGHPLFFDDGYRE